ncbi:MAG: glycosyltransferase family 39 protein, partial [Planctomycetota bacterium]|nr:glycosyltransferase family 39 protein [Planctomycetota bacterium]
MSDSGQHTSRGLEPARTEVRGSGVRRHFPALPLVMLVYVACSIWGLDWGLYSPERERYLFPADSQWNRARVAELRAAQPDDPQARGADVDPNPVEIGDTPVVLNESDERIAEIYSRYLLFSSQPDEMITFRAMRAMDPANLKLDPRLYQYGGLFIYPLGGLIKLAELAGWAQVADLSDFLNKPAQFAKFYLIGRAYVVLWGLLGVWIVYAIGWRLGDWRSGATAALLFALLPAVVALSHESKPHLPGAVLMLWAVLWALKYVETGGLRHRFMLALSCGLALGMVLSSLWIFVLIPLVEFLTRASTSERLARMFAFGMIGAMVYCVTNPYVIINLFVDFDVLQSNLENSTAMYHWGDFGAGLAS